MRTAVSEKIMIYKLKIEDSFAETHADPCKKTSFYTVP